MKKRIAAFVTASLLLASCGSKAPQEQAKEQPPASAAVPAETSTSATATPAPGTSPAGAAAAPEATPAQAAAPAAPPQPITYTVAAGTPIAVRTMEAVDTKHTKTENEFETTLVDALVVDGRTLAKPGATVIGTVVNADQGGRAKGKASLTLALSRILLSTGRYLTIQTNTVSQQAKSDTKKNVVRTGLMAGGGAAIGAIAGGGKGAAIGAAVGGGAGVATNLATRGPAAAIAAGTVLTFTTAQPASVTLDPPK
jgi:hypothetical protein